MNFSINSNSIVFDRLFPFYLILDENLLVKDIGISLNKINQNIIGRNFFDFFEINKPWSVEQNFISIKNNQEQFFIIHLKDSGLLMRGMFIDLEKTKELIFCGSPWLSNFDELVEKGLTISDFSLSDPSIDFLQLIKLHEINNQDIINLADKLKKKNAEIDSSEKFHRNIIEKTSDCIFRVDFDGRIKYANPSSCNLLETTNSELSKRLFTDIISTKNISLLQYKISKTIVQNLESFNIDLELKSTSNKSIEINMDIYVERLQNGIYYLIISKNK